MQDDEGSQSCCCLAKAGDEEQHRAKIIIQLVWYSTPCIIPSLSRKRKRNCVSLAADDDDDELRQQQLNSVWTSRCAQNSPGAGSRLDIMMLSPPPTPTTSSARKMTPAQARSLDVLRSCLSCQLCDKRITEPATLMACMHSFCYNCILEYTEDNWYCPGEDCCIESEL